ncbi:MAG: hypothetical protein Q9201_002377 [Fulgogasparrea decipioides]
MLSEINPLSFFLPLIPFLFVRAAVPSPRASTELICHTNHASECYPRIFQPTEKFQTVHDDQNLPPGLHVRINLATGVKEARLNIPEPDAEDVASGLTIIDDSELLGFQPVESEDLPIRHSHIDPQAPILPPKGDVAESSLFAESIAEVKDHASKDTDSLLPALTNLEDLSHSYHWGLTLAKDGPLIHKLFQLLLPSNLSLEVRSIATLVFGAAISNNEAALNAALSHFYNDEWPEGPLEAVIMALLHEQFPVLLNRMMFLLSSLCQDRRQLQRFLNADGAKLLMQVYDAEYAGQKGDIYRLRKKVTNFVLNHLLPPSDTRDAEDSDESAFDAEWTMLHLQQALEEGYQSADEKRMVAGT